MRERLCVRERQREGGGWEMGNQHVVVGDVEHARCRRRIHLARVFKAHRLVYLSTLGWIVINKRSELICWRRTSML